MESWQKGGRMGLGTVFKGPGMAGTGPTMEKGPSLVTVEMPARTWDPLGFRNLFTRAGSGRADAISTNTGPLLSHRVIP